MRKLQLAGQRFGRWIVLGTALKRGKHTFWICRCDCGTIKDVNTDSLHLGKSLSCGCINIEMLKARSTKHSHCLNHKTSKEYKAWSHAKSRCYASTDPKYPIYGNRGIQMCDKWLNDFAAFLEDMGPSPVGYSLDRINVNGNYEPKNCRWATPREQANNTRKNVIVRYRGEDITLKELSRRFDINYSALHTLVKYRHKEPVKAAKEMKLRQLRNHV